MAGPGRRVERAALALTGVLVIPIAGFPAPGGAEPEAVVLLHGLGRTPRSMRLLDQALSARGYRVVNLGYPGDREPIEESSRRLAGQLSDCQAGRAPRLHFSLPARLGPVDFDLGVMTAWCRSNGPRSPE